MGESTVHWWKSKLQMSFTLASTVRIPCLWCHTQCRFWARKAGVTGRNLLILLQPLFYYYLYPLWGRMPQHHKRLLRWITSTRSSRCSRWGMRTFKGCRQAVPLRPISPCSKGGERQPVSRPFPSQQFSSFSPLPLLALAFSFSPKPWSSSVLDIEATKNFCFQISWNFIDGLISNWSYGHARRMTRKSWITNTFFFFFLKFCLVLIFKAELLQQIGRFTAWIDNLLKCVPWGLHCTHRQEHYSGNSLLIFYNLNTKTGRPMTDTPT